jgi:hypothetical protein
MLKLVGKRKYLDEKIEEIEVKVRNDIHWVGCDIKSWNF